MQENPSRKLSNNGRCPSAGARFKCHSDASVPHFKPGNLSTMVALRPHAAGNHLLVEVCLRHTDVSGETSCQSAEPTTVGHVAIYFSVAESGRLIL